MTDTKILPGDVLFVWGDGIIDRVIEHVSHGPSHCAMFISDSTLVEAQAGRLIGECDLSFYLAKGGHLEIWRDSALTAEQRAEMIAYARTLYGESYDYALLPLEFVHFELGARLNWWHENKHRICSTYTDDMAQHAGRHWSMVVNPAPSDLVRGGILRKQYEWRGGEWATISPMASA